MMEIKKQFIGEFISELKKEVFNDSIIVLDTNILLNLYRYSDEARQTYMNAIKNHAERIYLTNQVMTEFFRNRKAIINLRGNFKNNLTAEIEKEFVRLKNNIRSIKSCKDILRTEDSLSKNILDLIDNNLYEIKNIISEQPEGIVNSEYIYGEDSILNEIVQSIGDKFFNDFNSDKIEELKKAGEKRFADKIPPGYKDNDKQKENKYGDYIIWEEIIALSIKEKKNILLISDDVKEDWMEIIEGKKIGVRPDLINEFYNLTNKLFYKISSSSFVKEFGIDMESKEYIIDEIQKYDNYNSNSYSESFIDLDREYSDLFFLLFQIKSLMKQWNKISESAYFDESIEDIMRCEIDIELIKEELNIIEKFKKNNDILDKLMNIRLRHKLMEYGLGSSEIMILKSDINSFIMQCEETINNIQTSLEEQITSY